MDHARTAQSLSSSSKTPLRDRSLSSHKGDKAANLLLTDYLRRRSAVVVEYRRRHSSFLVTFSQSDMMDDQNSVSVDVSGKANAKNATTTQPLYLCHVDSCRALERWQEWSSSYHEGSPTRDPGSRRATGKTISRHSLTEEDGRSVASHVPGSGKKKKKKRSLKSKNDRRSLSPGQTK